MVITAVVESCKPAADATAATSEIYNRKNLNQNGSVNKPAIKYRKEITYALFENDTEQIVDVIDEEATAKLQQSEEQSEIAEKNESKIDQTKVDAPKRKYQYVWLNITAMIALHVGGIYGIGMLTYAKSGTIYWTYLCLLLGSLGVQAGAHRLWAHRTYKANFGVRLFLSLCHVLALQNDIYEWSRDHRGHHKFADTDGDPHDSSKGFFFSHVGWLLVRKHPEVLRRGKTLDMSDLASDPIVMFQRKFYIPMVLLFWGAIPTFVPMYFWGENLVVSFTVCVLMRYAVSLNLTWCVNSWAHMYGNRPFDTRLDAVEASIRHVLMGEGFHNYHHAFPWDYSASELGAADVFNPCTAAIDFFHWMGWAWDLKKVSPSMIDSKKRKTGDPVWYHKRSTTFYEWSTGLLTMSMPLVTMFLIRKLFA